MSSDSTLDRSESLAGPADVGADVGCPGISGGDCPRHVSIGDGRP